MGKNICGKHLLLRRKDTCLHPHYSFEVIVVDAALLNRLWAQGQLEEKEDSSLISISHKANSSIMD